MAIHRDWPEWYEVKEIVSGMALATGIVAQCFPMRNRRLAPCRSLREGLISHHSGLACGERPVPTTRPRNQEAGRS